MRNRVTLLFLVAALTALVSAISGAPARAEKVVDPSTVAPEFREAAEKRRAEQVKLIECNNAAKIAKIQKRELPQFVAECFDKPADKP
ncbi:MAG TPA: hypothetical protein DEA80_14750 [Afipia sp.]|uniref:hypothetical protein n=1 Tax=unclassified Afipia TaxID=2642050 RepID=UPI000467A4C5|nr:MULTISPECIES: hypothetical protein [unclassified Afipia]MAH69440.1 hypothetical protein [Afipia sp.]OUX61431.1 MAG: hypothetical protein CBB64_09380 [Afipia sp. TMED4]HAO43585.1 hypothetical protein [Afipia sp.]HAP10259.1 hypothetical protein [Afipia sp.]HAQ94796.1 hypothetical protein [Afipia sp.]